MQLRNADLFYSAVRVMDGARTVKERSSFVQLEVPISSIGNPERKQREVLS